MMDRVLVQKLEDAVWIGRSLFERSKTSGSSANMSFFHNGTMERKLLWHLEGG